VAAGQVGLTEQSRWGALAPVVHRGRWIAGGLLLQVLGVAAPVTYIAMKAKKENVGGSITLSTVRLAWHNSLHNRAGLALMIAGAVMFAIGAVLLARPFARSWPLLVIVVPLAALLGLLVLGAGALIIALIIGLAILTEGDLFGWGDGGGWGSSERRKKKDDQAVTGDPGPGPQSADLG